MSQAPVVTQAPPTGGSLRLSYIDWKTYTRLLRALGELPGVRITYDRGELEIMSPRKRHDGSSRFLGDMIFLLTEELDLPLIRGGSVTLRSKPRKRGIEPDECFWIANAAQMAGRDELDLKTDPPPDLGLEVDVSRSSMDRLSIYAALGVPEVWRLDGPILTFYILDAGQYQVATNSRSFPQVTAADLVPFLQQAHQAANQNDVTRLFRTWVRQRHGLTP